MRYEVRLSKAAEADLQAIRDFIERQASEARSAAYLQRIHEFLSGLDLFPERGTLRNDVRPGLRVIGFERRIAIAFVVEDHALVILRILYAGRQAGDSDDPLAADSTPDP